MFNKQQSKNACEQIDKRNILGETPLSLCFADAPRLQLVVPALNELCDPANKQHLPVERCRNAVSAAEGLLRPFVQAVASMPLNAQDAAPYKRTARILTEFSTRFQLFTVFGVVARQVAAEPRAPGVLDVLNILVDAAIVAASSKYHHDPLPIAIDYSILPALLSSSSNPASGMRNETHTCGMKHTVLNMYSQPRFSASCSV